MPDALHETSPGEFRGVFPVFQTPFGENEEIDWETLGQELEWLAGLRVDGIAMAMVSEVLRMSSDERDRVAEFFVSRIDGRCRSIISVGAECTHTAIRHAKLATSIGADAIMAIPPISVSIDDHERWNYFAAIVDASPLPLIVQDASGYVGQPMSIAFQQRLLAEFGAERIFFKPEAHPIGPRLTELSNATQGKAVIFEGSGGLHLLDSFSRGIAATMPGSEIADGIQLLWNALVHDDLETIQVIEPLIGQLVELQSTLDEFLAIEKHILKRRGIFKSTRVRGPVGYRLATETAAIVDQRLDALLAAMEDCQ